MWQGGVVRRLNGSSSLYNTGESNGRDMAAGRETGPQKRNAHYRKNNGRMLPAWRNETKIYDSDYNLLLFPVRDRRQRIQSAPGDWVHSDV